MSEHTYETTPRTEHYPGQDEIEAYLKWQEANATRTASETIDYIGAALTLNVASVPEQSLYTQAEAATTPEIDTTPESRYESERPARGRGYFALNAVALDEMRRPISDLVPYDRALGAHPSFEQAA